MGAVQPALLFELQKFCREALALLFAGGERFAKIVKIGAFPGKCGVFFDEGKQFFRLGMNIVHGSEFCRKGEVFFSEQCGLSLLFEEGKIVARAER